MSRQQWKVDDEYCGVCAFYKPGSRTKEIGQCRRNPPASDGFPVVAESDWCGEFRRKDVDTDLLEVQDPDHAK